MLVNPGGPGGSGLLYSIYGSGALSPATATLRTTGLASTPRGVGDSKPALTCDPSYFGLNRPNFNPYTRAIEN